MHSRSRPGLELEHAGGKAETDFFAWTLKDDFSPSETQALRAPRQVGLDPTAAQPGDRLDRPGAVGGCSGAPM